MADSARTPFAEFDVIGRPATFESAHESAWKAAVRDAVAALHVSPQPGRRFQVEIEFRTSEPTTANHRWDLDDLVKPTLDAMEGIFGLRAWRGLPQPNDDLVVKLEASKRTINAGELAGAHIAVWLVS